MENSKSVGCDVFISWPNEDVEDIRDSVEALKDPRGVSLEDLRDEVT